MAAKHFIVNIGRELGSGGKDIAERLSRDLNIAFYDKELINLASKESGLCEEFFEKADEKTSQSLLGGLFGSRFPFITEGAYPYNSCLSNDSLFKIQSDVIRELAERKSCVFVGRCADYILRDFTNCVNIFITAPKKVRVQRLVERLNLNETEARNMIHHSDKKRSEYYNYYTNRTWGAASTYHLCLDSSLLGVEESEQFLAEFIRKRLNLYIE